MSNGVSALLILVVLGSGVRTDSDGLCSRLNHLERELSISRSARSTSVKIMWLPGTGSFVCEAHKQHPGARELCRWLPKHMSWEYPQLLPSAMLACYGMGNGKLAHGAFVTESFAGRTKARNRIQIETKRRSTTESFPSVRLTIQKGAR